MTSADTRQAEMMPVGMWNLWTGPEANEYILQMQAITSYYTYYPTELRETHKHREVSLGLLS